MGVKDIAKNIGNAIIHPQQTHRILTDAPIIKKPTVAPAEAKEKSELRQTAGEFAGAIKRSLSRTSNKTQSTANSGTSAMMTVARLGWEAIKSGGQKLKAGLGNIKMAFTARQALGKDLIPFKKQLSNLSRQQGMEIREHYKEVRPDKKFKTSLPNMSMDDLQTLKQSITDNTPVSKPEIPTAGMMSLDNIKNFINFMVAPKKLELIDEQIKTKTVDDLMGKLSDISETDKDLFKTALSNMSLSDVENVKSHYDSVGMTEKFKDELPKMGIDLLKTKKTKLQNAVANVSKKEAILENMTTNQENKSPVSLDDIKDLMDHITTEQKIKLIDEQIQAKTPQAPSQ